MIWPIYVLIGASINALCNYGYKKYSKENAIPVFLGAAYFSASVLIFSYAIFKEPGQWTVLFSGMTPYIILGMGVGTSIVFIMMVTALKRGPISIVDPMWACIYALVSVGVGMIIAGEKPSIPALCGVGLYLAGAFLMASAGKADDPPPTPPA